MGIPHKILVIEDDPKYQILIRDALGADYDVTLVRDAETGVRIARELPPDLAVIDLFMPQIDGMKTCELLRNSPQTHAIPVIMLTASLDLQHRIKAFKNGVDDFITKPFHKEDLIARVDAKIRRASGYSASRGLLSCGNLELDLNLFEARVEKERIPLTALQFQLLKCLAQNRDRVMSRQEIIDKTWKNCVVSTATVNTHIMAIRQKLAPSNCSISTVYGAGYILKVG